MPGLTEDNLGCMILYALKLFSLLSGIPTRGDLLKSILERMRETAGLLATSVDRKERSFPVLCN